uniref:Uncharacterized protein n=1 Tax=Anguilla anguilla TaxID=7936 RepID=A0A0E9SRQ5_ANGAN
MCNKKITLSYRFCRKLAYAFFTTYAIQ